MSWWRVCLFSVALASCTKPNPRSCQDGTCGEPAFPVCDVDGSLGGEPQTCIAVECTPGELESCRGDSERRCNSDGTNYDVTRCERGCDDTIGCRACSANETVCSEGRVQRCDSAGAIESSEECPLGCLDDQPRCRGYYLSNALTMYLDNATTAMDLDLADGGSVDTTSGTVLNHMNIPVPVVTHLVNSTGGPPIRVFVARRVTVGDVVVRASGTGTNGAALAILATDDISIEGRLDLAGQTDPRDRTPGGVGGVAFGSCIGRPGGSMDTSGSYLWSAGGGGGHATPGGAGGKVGNNLPGGIGGQPMGDETLVPLRGGCDGAGGQGGGAIQLSSAKKIIVGSGAFINANGGVGNAFLEGPGWTGGGGAGGGILLEAPTVELGAGVRLLTNGGPAGTIAEPALMTSLTTAISPGGRCTSTTLVACGNGGDGAALEGPATSGADVPSSSTADDMYSGGGGGGRGYIRINTKPGGLDRADDAVISGSISVGTLRLRTEPRAHQLPRRHYEKSGQSIEMLR